MASWEAALDALEERIRRQEAFLDGTAGPPPDGDLPQPTTVLPAEHLVRAAALLDRSRALESEVAARMAKMPRRGRRRSAYSR